MKKTLLLLGVLSSQLVGVCSVFVTWGDSLTFGYDGYPYPMQLEALTGITTLNRGANGQTSSQIADRFAAEPALFGERIVIWSGRNNLFDHTGIQADIASMVSHITSTEYLVLGLINRHDEPLGSAGYNAVLDTNLDLANTYGTHFIDIQHVLVHTFNPLVAVDIQDLNNDVIPDWLEYPDLLHLNSTGYGVVAQTVANYFASVPEPAETTGIVATGCALAALGLRKRRA